VPLQPGCTAQKINPPGEKQAKLSLTTAYNGCRTYLKRGDKTAGNQGEKKKLGRNPGRREKYDLLLHGFPYQRSTPERKKKREKRKNGEKNPVESKWSFQTSPGSMRGPVGDETAAI